MTILANIGVLKQGTVARWRWVCGMIYVIAVALIWIIASFVVQHVEDSGVPPFLITYLCNSLFVVYIPIVEVRRYIERLVREQGWGRSMYGKLVNENETGAAVPQPSIVERLTPLEVLQASTGGPATQINSQEELSNVSVSRDQQRLPILEVHCDGSSVVTADETEGIELAEDLSDQRWTRRRTALVGLTICPFWFLAQLSFNLSLKYTTVTSNTILSTTSSLFTFLVSLQFLGERFTWLKLASVLLCMIGTVVVSIGDSWKAPHEIAPHPFIGDLICLSSAMFYATYTALIRVNIPDEEDRKGNVSTALIFGYLGLFNALLLAPVALLLFSTGIESFDRLTMTALGLILGKGLIDNVLSDYLWARAVLLTSPTAATAGLTIQVPIAAVVDSFRGIVPSFMGVAGGVAVLIGFFGINQPESRQSSSIDEQGEKAVDNFSLSDPVTAGTVVQH